MNSNDDTNDQRPEGGEAAAGPPAADAPTEEAPTREARAEATAAQPPPPPPPPPQRRFLRSRDDRVIAGVAGGLGKYFDIDPVIIRIAAVVSIFFGGLGVIAYLLTAIVVPADDGAGNPAPGSRGAAAVRILAITALVVIAIGGFGLLVAAAMLVTGIGYGLVVAGVIIVLGVALIATSFAGGARWLIVPALALTIGAGAATAADLDLEGGIGSETHTPASAAEIPDDGYNLGIGRLAIDLRDIDWTPQRVVHLDARLGIGEVVVAVPADVCVEAEAHAGAGALRVAGQGSDGPGVDLTVAAGAVATPRLVFDGDVDMGAIRVLNDDSADIGDAERGWRDFDNGRYRDANAEACAA